MGITARAWHGRPGRVNLIGEHTDYNDGFTMPMALPFDTVVAASDAGDARDGPVHVDSEGFGSVVIDPAGDPRAIAPWARHIAGVVALLRQEGVASGGWRASIATDIPTGASLSSSAAIEVAVIVGLLARSGLDWPPIDVARLGQRVENEVVGLPSGIMDQFISAGAVAGCASLMDCRAFTLEPRRIPSRAVVAVMDTGTRRQLADAAYADRRRACERAAAMIGVGALRDATPSDLDRVTDEHDRRRARHVVSENARTLAAAAAMDRDDAPELGRLMSDSHASLRDDFEVSAPALDAIVEAALDESWLPRRADDGRRLRRLRRRIGRLRSGGRVRALGPRALRPRGAARRGVDVRSRARRVGHAGCRRRLSRYASS